MEKAMFGAGCFWGVEEAFQKIVGVKKTTVGYAGGHMNNPSYKEVCSGTTGHAEVVELEFDPDVVTYEELLHVFWQIHNPTLLNRQGPDVGSQYRSVIFFYSALQEETAKYSIREAQKNYSAAIVTQLVPASPFYRAEEYHQCYFKKNR